MVVARSAPATDGSLVEVRAVDADEFTRLAPQFMAIYVEAMGYAPEVATSRLSTALLHARLAGFHAYGAFVADVPVGFGYGYLTQEGQWWHGQVRKAIGGRRSGWLDDAFELCELHVEPAYHGVGAGRRLLHSLLAATVGRTVLLSTPDGPSRARRLYDRNGFRVLAEGFFFSTDRRPFTVMGRPPSRPEPR